MLSLVCRVEHGDDVLRRDVGQDVVDLLEDEAAAGREDRDLLGGRDGGLLPACRARGSSAVSQPPPQKVSRPPKSRFSPAASMPTQVTWTGLIASSPASIRSSNKRADAAAAVEHDLHVGQLLRPPPHQGVPRLEELAVHGRRHLRPVLHSQVVAEDDHVDIRADRAGGTAPGWPDGFRPAGRETRVPGGDFRPAA